MRQAWAHSPRFADRPPKRLAGQALSGISHAERAVNEDFDGKINRLADSLDLGQGQLAGQDHARAAQLAGKRHAFLRS